MDISTAIIPKSDQLNADDLIVGPKTIRITRVEVRTSGEQLVSIFFEGDNGKPWKPCKSMLRALVYVWGADSTAYVGRRLTLVLDPSVKWGGKAVGGIRISHMSHLPNNAASSTFMLTATKGVKMPFTVLPIANDEVIFDRAGNLAKLESAAAKGYDSLVAEWKTIKGNKALTDEWGRLKEIATQAGASKNQQSETAKD